MVRAQELSLYMLYIRSTLEENTRDDEKENQEIKNIGGKKIKPESRERN